MGGKDDAGESAPAASGDRAARAGRQARHPRADEQDGQPYATRRHRRDEQRAARGGARLRPARGGDRVGAHVEPKRL